MSTACKKYKTMNANIEILDDIKHRTITVDFDKARSASRKENLIPVVLSEFHTLMFHYPIVFVKDRETGEFTCSLLLGLATGANLLDGLDISNDEQLPLNLRRLPFCAIESPDNTDGTAPLIGINMASPGVGHGEFLFENKSESFDRAIAALSEVYRGYKETRAFIKTAIELDLIGKLKAEIQYKDKPTLILDGLYGIDENKIARIIEQDNERKNLFLTIARYAYAQSFSLYNMKKFVYLPS